MAQPVNAYPAGADRAAREPANAHAAAPTDVLAHPGAGAPSKCWPAERWQQLLETLENRGRHVRILIGETELDRWPPATLDRWRRRWPLIAPPDARALAHAIAPHQLFIGHDTGPTHLAAALGLPTLALFGPTPAFWWRPVGPHVLALHPPSPTPMDWLHVPHVLDAIDRLAQPPNHGLSPKPTPAA
jgi:ADP-heptose:LPS heptosyltransferase